MITPRQAIDAWTRFRDGELAGARGKDYSAPDGTSGLPHDPDYYGYDRVQVAIGSVCPMKYQRKILEALLIHVYRDGQQTKNFMKANLGRQQEDILDETLDVLIDAIDVAIKQKPQPEMPKAVEIA